MLGSKARHRRGLLPLLALLLIAAPVQAQLPDIEPSRDYYAANVIPQQGSVSIEYHGFGSANIPVLVEDVSLASNEDQTTRERNTIRLDVEVVGNDTRGWTASVSKFTIPTRPGEVHELSLNIIAGALVEQPTVEVRIQAVYQPTAGDETVTNTSVMAVAESFPRLTMQMDGLPEDFSPDQTRQLGLTVTNDNFYPDMVSFRVNGPDDWMISPPSSIRLGPGETKTVHVDVRSPENPWFLYTSKSGFITVEAVSETNDKTLMTTGVPITQTGATFPIWAAPHLFMLLLGVGLITVRTRRKLRERRLEKGKPSYPGLDPEHEAEFEALKIEDPEQADTLERRLQTLYEQRKEAWKEAYERRRSDEDALEETYRERHEALVDAREAEVDAEDVERRADRRRLLERKRELLQRKRAQLAEEESTDAGPSDASAASD